MSEIFAGFGKGGRADAGDGDKAEKTPIANEERGADCDENKKTEIDHWKSRKPVREPLIAGDRCPPHPGPLPKERVRGEEYEGGKEIGHGNAMEDACEINVFESIGEAAHVENAQQEQDDGANENPFDRYEPASAFEHPADGENERDADDKNEQRKNEIIEMKSSPFAMFHLVRESAGEW